MATESSQHLVETESDINTKLIHLVKDFPFIYDPNDPKHKDRNLLERTWTSIASQINLSVEETKTKWQRLRNNFSKAIERRVKTPRSGSAATKLQKPWIYEADMEFLRLHLQHHRASSSSLSRESPIADVESNPLSSQLNASDNPEHSLDIAPISHSSSPRSTQPVQQGFLNSAPKRKAQKRDGSDLDSAVLSYINRTSARDDEPADPAIGWFKSLLPMYNSLTSIEKLEFQSKVVLELRSLMLAKEQRMTCPPIPMPHNNTHVQPPPPIPMPHNYTHVQPPPQEVYSSSRASSCSISDYDHDYYQDYD